MTRRFGGGGGPGVGRVKNRVGEGGGGLLWKLKRKRQRV